ncbi:MAG: adenosine deaminase [bacterium]|nr:adenosine deaminase [bacterium]
MPIDYEWLYKLPKTDLHVHLDGSVRPATLLELVDKAGIEIPATTEDEVRKLTQVQDGDKSLTHYLRAFSYTLPAMQTVEALDRVAYELAIDAAAENVRLMEVRYSPLLHRDGGLHNMEIIDAVRAGLSRAEEETGIVCGQILCGIRSMTPEKSLELAQAALMYKDKGIVAFDLAGAEKDYPAKQHRAAFYFILNHNLNSTLHAGEAFGPESIAQALHYCGTHRIGHGTRLYEDESLMGYVNDHRIPLEICLNSNIHTGAVTELHDHPFRKYLELGLRVTLNTDNRLISNTTVTKELFDAVTTFNLGLEEIYEIILNGFKSSFLPHQRKQVLIRKVVQELEELGALAKHDYTNGRGDHL